MTRMTNWIVGEALALAVIAGSSTVATSAHRRGAPDRSGP